MSILSLPILTSLMNTGCQNQVNGHSRYKTYCPQNFTLSQSVATSIWFLLGSDGVKRREFFGLMTTFQETSKCQASAISQVSTHDVVMGGVRCLEQTTSAQATS